MTTDNDVHITLTITGKVDWFCREDDVNDNFDRYRLQAILTHRTGDETNVCFRISRLVSGFQPRKYQTIKYGLTVFTFVHMLKIPVKGLGGGGGVMSK